MEYFPAPLEKLVEQFARLPGIGGKTAQRLAFHVLSMPLEQAEGFAKIVDSADGNSNAAIKLMLADKMEKLISLQTEAIKNIKIDKVTVWDSGTAGKDGKNSTADFISGIMKSLPPINDMLDLAGMQLPEYLAQPKGESENALCEENKAE